MRRKRVKVTRLPKDKPQEPYIKKIGDGLYEVGPNPKLYCGDNFLKMLFKVIK